MFDFDCNQGYKSFSLTSMFKSFILINKDFHMKKNNKEGMCKSHFQKSR